DHLAHHDPLTGLPNRLLFNERVQHALERRTQGCVLLPDQDFFKDINESVSHSTGDEGLKRVADRLLEVREGLTVARLGGGECALLWEDGGGAGTARQLPEAVQ